MRTDEELIQIAAQPAVPECEKWAAVDSSSIMDFVEWLTSQGLKICTMAGEALVFRPGSESAMEHLQDYREMARRSAGDSSHQVAAALLSMIEAMQPELVYEPESNSPTEWAYCFGGVDADKLEQERRALLDWNRKLHELTEEEYARLSKLKSAGRLEAGCG